MHWLTTQASELASQAFDAQSVFARQPKPFPQGGQVPPPQSTAVSLPSLVVFAQVAGAHRWLDVLHTVLLQSKPQGTPPGGHHHAGGLFAKIESLLDQYRSTATDSAATTESSTLSVAA